jgi:exodeoxyribonuclease VII large subunit
MNEILSVKELTAAIKRQLESKFSFITVKGEISNFKQQSSGHLYFTLKDEEAQISAVLFRGNAAGLSRLPKDGDQVILKGELSVYAPRGNYQIIVRQLQFAGIGELLLKLHELKKKLEAKGWLNSEKKKPLPKWPKTIGVITSPTGSVIRDIITILTRRFSGFQLILNPVKVQGEGAAQEIALAIQECNRYKLTDVLIVGRGGGSLEDLWAFNEERVAEAIFNSKIPIISAVGHETDFTIADLVADVRAPTPSAAAEIVMSEKKQQLDFLHRSEQRLKQTLSLLIQSSRHKLIRMQKHPCFTDPYYLLGRYYQMCDDTRSKLTHAMQKSLLQKTAKYAAVKGRLQTFNPSTQLALWRQRFSQQEKAINQAIQHKMKAKSDLFAKLTAHLLSIDPKNLLKKGYCIPFDEKENSVILSAIGLEEGTRMQLLFHDGKAKVIVKD